jgi:type IV pilus assembly protein PilW
MKVEWLNKMIGIKCGQTDELGLISRGVSKHRRSRCQSGFTLIEIMIALLVGLFLLGGIMQIFINTKQTYRVQDSLSRLQENARYALELLTHDIRLTGYFGCGGSSVKVIANNPLIAPVAHSGNGTVVVASTITGGNDNAGSFTTPFPALTSSPLSSAVSGTDALTVQFGESCGGYTTAPMTTVNPNGGTPAKMSTTQSCGSNITPGTDISVGTPLVISDCATADIFRAATDTTQNKDTTGTATSAFSKAQYNAGSEIMLYRSYTYYIRAGSSGVSALWRFDNNKTVVGNQNPGEIVEGISNMQILYGVDSDSDGTANFYVASASVTDMNLVVSVRITLTAQSIDANLTTIEGGVLSRDFTTTIALRNRIF